MEASANLVKTQLPPIASNPIGVLMEISQKHSIEPPTFEITSDDAPSNLMTFTCCANFNNVVATAFAKTKKEAKRLAAIDLLTKISVNESQNSEDEFKEFTKLYSDDAIYESLTNSAGESTLKLWRKSSSKSIKAITMRDLERNNQVENFKLLDELSIEHGFDYKFIKMPDFKSM